MGSELPIQGGIPMCPINTDTSGSLLEGEIIAYFMEEEIEAVICPEHQGQEFT